MKEYWLTLQSNTWLWVKGKKGLVYNSINYQMFHFEYSALSLEKGITGVGLSILKALKYQVI